MADPTIVVEERDYIVVFKPKGVHGAPLTEGEGGTLLAWCATRYPEILGVKGRKTIEGGLLHRLDLETEGLVVLARNQAFYDALSAQQAAGLFLKEYEALSIVGTGALPGFPAAPTIPSVPAVIESAFRPFGPDRKAVRPVPFDRRDNVAVPLVSGRRSRDVALDQGAPYRTELLEITRIDDGLVRIRARLARGFRHQIRCHLAWIGYPIAGDGLYGGGGKLDSLSLSAIEVSFRDPLTGSPVCYTCASSTGSPSSS
jgi:23S rRNA pseudouridine1911/1915/1917 synthase